MNSQTLLIHNEHANTSSSSKKRTLELTQYIQTVVRLTEVLVKFVHEDTKAVDEASHWDVDKEDGCHHYIAVPVIHLVESVQHNFHTDKLVP